jgi:hypothetical protein
MTVLNEWSAEYTMQRARVPKDAIRELSRIPGVGKSLAADLYLLGFRQVAELKTASPEKMVDDLTRLVGCHVDRCVLYVFRCSVYFASHDTHDPELLKWWNWKS